MNAIIKKSTQKAAINIEFYFIHALELMQKKDWTVSKKIKLMNSNLFDSIYYCIHYSISLNKKN